MRNVGSRSTRNTRDSLTLAVWLLLGLTALAALLALAGREQGSWPSIANRQPSGLAAFAELLRRDGYEVVLERHRRPKLPADALLISIHQSRPRGFFQFDDTDERLVEQALWAHSDAGGRRVAFSLGEDFDSSSRTAQEVAVRNLATGEELQMVVDMMYDWQDENALFASEDSSWAVYYSTEVQVASALPLTNRFLDEGDNAEAALGLVRKLAAPGSQVVFYEAAFGNIAQRRFFGSLGPWAVAAQWQAILLLLVVAWTLGQRFGLPVREFVRERGTRELVDALAETMRFGKQHSWAGQMVRRQAMERARRVLRIPNGTPESEVVDRLSDPAREALAQLDATCKSWSRKEHVVRAANRFDSAMRDFERRSAPRRPKKSSPEPR